MSVAMIHLAAAFDALDYARNSNTNERIADYIDRAMADVRLAIVLTLNADDECPECGGMVPRVVACGVPNCPRKRGDQP